MSNCTVWISPIGCPEDMVRARFIHAIVVLAVLAPTTIFFVVSTVRRWLYSRDYSVNTFSIIAVLLYLSSIFTALYHILLLAKVERGLPFVSFCAAFGNNCLICTSPVLCDAFLQLGRSETQIKAHPSANPVYRWVLGIIAAFYMISASIAAIFMGYGAEYYAIAFPYFVGTNVILFAVLWGIFIIGGFNIKRRLEESRRVQRLPYLTDSAKHVSDVINRSLVVFSGIVVVAIGSQLWIASDYVYIDSHTWATEVAWTSVAGLAITYTGFMGFQFWLEGSRIARQKG